jgi:competence protein ComFC
MFTSMQAFLQRFWRDKLDIIFPRSCVHCGGVVDGGNYRYLCPLCAKLLFIVHAPHCTTCGHPFFGEIGEEERECEHCEVLVPCFGQGKTAVLLQGAGRSVVHALKYHGGLHVLEDMVAIMRQVPGYADYVRGAVLVPVPLHGKKEEKRGFNQSRLLAECMVAAADGKADIQDLLQRLLNTASQTRYDRAARQENLKNAFALATGATINPGQRYILVDDVFTTGSTLNSCATVLRRGGVLSLDVVTFGHG